MSQTQQTGDHEVKLKGWDMAGSWNQRLLTFSRSPSNPFCPFFGEGSPTKSDYGKTGTLILTLEDLDFGC